MSERLSRRQFLPTAALLPALAAPGVRPGAIEPPRRAGGPNRRISLPACSLARRLNVQLPGRGAGPSLLDVAESCARHNFDAIDPTAYHVAGDRARKPPPFPSMKIILAATAVLLASTLPAQTPGPVRPRITGISHAAFFVSDLAKARAFYEGFLGFQSPYSIPRRQPGEHLVWIKINDRQSVELFPGSEAAPDADRLYHLAVEVDDADAMLAYLRARGIAGLPPTSSPLGRIGNKNFTIRDPAGNGVEFVQYLPEGWTRREQGKFLPATRVSKRMSHVGVMVGQLEASLRFYGEILGFRETWRGSAGGQTLSWVNLRVPDGEDYIEFMLYEKFPGPDRLKTMHHICLEVPDVAQAGALLAGRPYPAGNKPPTEMKVGVNGKRQINYYDSDGTRVEIMEPNTHDGKLRPPSNAPAPVGEIRPSAVSLPAAKP